MSEKPRKDRPAKRDDGIPVYGAEVGVIELISDRDLAGEPLPPLVELIPCGPPKTQGDMGAPKDDPA